MTDYGIVKSEIRPIKLMDEANLKAQADLEYIAMMTEVELE